MTTRRQTPRAPSSERPPSSAAPRDVTGSVKDFPILSRRIAGKRLVYLDNGATTQKPHSVLAAMDAFYAQSNANIHRGLYPLSEEATRLYEEARVKAATFLHAPSAAHIVFTSGTTDAINLVAHGWGPANLHPGDEILLTPHEHHANIVPWQEAARATGATLVYCSLLPDLTIDVADLKRKITRKTKLLAITHVSNVLGTVTPLEEIIPYAKRHGVTVLVDGAQAVAHLPVDVSALGCDFYAFSGHKLYGPTGIGVLYLASAHLTMAPYRTGGDMIDDVTEQTAIYATDGPRRFEAGTPNIAGAIGLGAAIDYVRRFDWAQIRSHEERLATRAWRGLKGIPGVTLLGPVPSSARLGVIPFLLDGVHPHDVSQLLADEGVCIRSGKHCAHPFHTRIGARTGTNRASLGIYSTDADVDALIAAVRKAREVFR